jgi:outer membrane protein TolC
LDTFKQTLGIPLTIDVFLDDSSMRELEAAGMKEITVDADKVFGVAVERHLSLLNEIDRFEDIKRKIKVAANDLLPGLDIKSSAGLDWDDEENYREFDVEEVKASLGLKLDLPIDRWVERNDYRKALISFESQIRSLARTLDTKRNEIEVGLRNLELNRNVYMNNVLEIRNAEERMKEQRMREQAGGADPQTLIDARNDLIEAENNLVSTLVDLLGDRLALQLNVGVIDTDPEKFWLQTQILASDPNETAETQVSPEASRDVVSPEELFKETL